MDVETALLSGILKIKKINAHSGPDSTAGKDVFFDFAIIVHLSAFMVSRTVK